MNTNTIGCRIYLHSGCADEMLDYLLPQKEQIESELGFKLEWNPNPNNKDKVIVITKEFDMETEDGQKQAIAWLKEKTKKMHSVFSKLMKQYK